MAKPGPKPLPSNVHIMRGNPSKKPLANLSDEVRPEIEIPNCPKHLQAEARKEYKRISVELESLGLISKIDRAALAAYCSAWAEYVFCEEKIAELNKNDPLGLPGYVTKTPSGYQQMSIWVSIRTRALYTMKTFAVEFGMTPSSRSRVTPGELTTAYLPGMEPPEAPKTGWNAL